MSEECNNQCSECSEECSSRQPVDFKEQPHKLAKISKVIAVVSGKGGVGKSSVTALLAAGTQRKGGTTAVLDADITGPSIPRAFGVEGHAQGNDMGLFPMESAGGTSIMSVNLLLENTTDPVVWRGPVLAGTVKQFWTDVMWGDIDTMFVDLPPGTGDVPLTVFQSLPVDGIVIVTTPQELVSMIVEKAVKMARMMNIPILSLVENMSYVTCPDCGKKIYPFGESRLEEIAKKYDIPVTDRIPMNPDLAAACDGGTVEQLEGVFLPNTLAKLEEISQPVEE